MPALAVACPVLPGALQLAFPPPAAGSEGRADTSLMAAWELLVPRRCRSGGR